MSLSHLLEGDYRQDDQVLETDTMRFVAIMGIVFWIIFALIKSIPFQTEDQPTTGVAESQAVEFISVPLKEQLKTVSSYSPPETHSKKAQKGLRLEFRTLDDLLALMDAKKVKIYCLAGTSGFEILFSGTRRGEGIVFETERALPPVLWEIKSEESRDFFLVRLTQQTPSIRVFPEKHLMVAFLDHELERKLENALGSLQGRDKDGVLSVTGDGKFMFQEDGSSSNSPALTMPAE